jgi:hypothetical protein
MTEEGSNPGEQASSSNETFSKETLWEFVPLDDYRPPDKPAVSAAQHRWVSLKRLFGRGKRDGNTPAKAEADLSGLPRERLDTLVRPLDWDAGAEVLRQTLARDARRLPVSFLIGPPGGGVADLLRALAARQDARRIEPPSFDDLLAGGTAWLDAWTGDAQSWVLPHLEHCWLRHPAGLESVRALLARASIGDLGRGVIGCDSWAWAYLRHVAPMPVAGVLTVQAFDSQRLARLLRSLAAVDADRRLHFCNARTGKRIIAVNDEDDGDGGLDMQNLAAQAGGNPAIARALWRARLRSEPHGDENGESPQQDEPPQGERDTEIVWVSGLRDELELELPDSLREDAALVLHTLLLHNGLPAWMLAALLPLHRFRVQTILPQLSAAEIVERDVDDRWRVTATGYAPVRAFLRERGFPIGPL